MTSGIRGNTFSNDSIYFKSFSWWLRSLSMGLFYVFFILLVVCLFSSSFINLATWVFSSFFNWSTPYFSCNFNIFFSFTLFSIIYFSLISLSSSFYRVGCVSILAKVWLKSFTSFNVDLSYNQSYSFKRDYAKLCL